MARRNEVQYVSFYTAGSAAMKIEPVSEPKKKANLPKQRRAKKIRIFVDPMALIGGCVAVVMLVMMLSGLGQLYAARQQEAQLQDYITRLAEQNIMLDAQFQAGYDANEIYDVAIGMGMIPADQAERVQVSVQIPAEVEEEHSAWENIYTFLVGLFA